MKSIILLALVGSISAGELMTIGEKLNEIKLKHQATNPVQHNNQTNAAVAHFIQSQKKDVKALKVLAEVKTAAKARREPIWPPHVKYSDQLANGDADDDKELEDEDDPNDFIVDDNGFTVDNLVHADDKRLAEWKASGIMNRLVQIGA